MKSHCVMLIETEVSSKWINYNNLFSNSIWQLFPFQNSQLWFCLWILYKLCNRPISMSPIHCLLEGTGRQLCSCGGYGSVEPGGGVSPSSAIAWEHQGKSVCLSHGPNFWIWRKNEVPQVTLVFSLSSSETLLCLSIGHKIYFVEVIV